MNDENERIKIVEKAQARSGRSGLWVLLAISLILLAALVVIGGAMGAVALVGSGLADSLLTGGEPAVGLLAEESREREFAELEGRPRGERGGPDHHVGGINTRTLAQQGMNLARIAVIAGTVGLGGFLMGWRVRRGAGGPGPA